MLLIDDKLISEDLFDKHFVCDLSSCKGACCIEGESGAPLEEEELTILDDIFEDVAPFLRKEGAQAITEQGKYIQDSDGDWVTPLRDGKECAYTVFDEKGIAGCGIEKAYFAGEITFRKPISCHLYPIRTKQLSEYEAMNYHQWPICNAACECGSKLQMPIYKFCKDALIRKYGQEFYEKLEFAENNRE
ncbi:MAG: DUF3109 family protein [Bacteroidota bacterium]